MVFSSIPFLFFLLPLFLIADGFGRAIKNNTLRNVFLLSISLLFYIWGESLNVLLLIVLGLLNYFGGIWLGKVSRPRLLLGLLISLNLSILFIFKYLSWILSFFFSSGNSPNILLPLGISFFTFHAISYIIDVYRKDIPPARSPLDFMTYFCMFPHLVAGPIVRYRHVQNELKVRIADPELFSFGVYRFLLGFNKKILIANTVAPLADLAFDSGFSNTCGNAWIGIAAYTIQIYFDFSAYSDMAIGLAAMAGFRFEENFTRPYSASSIKEFWRRWHISLSSWLKDYLYIPLGGNRCGQARVLFNLLIVFFLCGLWHGAEFTFIIWGLWHGLFLVLERVGLESILNRIPNFIRRFYTLLVVMIGWVFFRAADTPQAIDYLAAMFNPSSGFSLTLLYFNKAVFGLAVGILLCLISDRLLPRPTSHEPSRFSWVSMSIQAVLFVPALGSLLTSSRNPFIYFNF